MAARALAGACRDLEYLLT
eukprot:s12353_g1.t1